MAALNLTIKHLALILFLAFFFVLPTYAQPIVEWQKCLGGTNDDNARSISPTKDGGYIVVGATMSANGDVSSNYGSADYWVVKINQNGALQWQQSLGGGKSDMAFSVEQTSDDGYIIAGYTDSKDGLVPYSQGYTDFWFARLDADGNLQWQKTLGGSGHDNGQGVLETSDGNFVIAGATNSNDGDVSGNHGSFDGWVVKMDAAGVPLWMKCYGGTNTDHIQSIQQTSDGGFIMTGYTTSADISGHHGAEDVWVVKIDSQGNLQWQKALGGTGSDTGESIRQTEDGGYIVVGNTNSNNGDVSGNHGDVDAWLVKLDPNGNLQWQKCYGGSGQDMATSIGQTADKGFIIGAHTASTNGDVTANHGGSDYWVVRTDGSGNIQWQKCYGGSGSDRLASLATTNDGWFVAAGSTTSRDGDVSGIHGSGSDFWVVKFGGCIIESEITITASDTVICEGDSITFTAVTVNAGAEPSYQWQLNGANTGTNEPTYSTNALKNGDQVACILTTTVPGCPTSYTVSSNKETISVKPTPGIQFTPSELNAREGQQLQLNPTVSGNIASFEWTSAGGSSLQDPQSLTPSTTPLTTTTTYQLKVVDNNGCSATQDIVVKVFNNFYMPNSFTPNGDGYNDVFRIPPSVPIQLKEFSVFDRWGNRIFTTKDAGKGWDGTYQGRAQNSGVYVWTCRYQLEGEGERTEKGTVVLVR